MVSPRTLWAWSSGLYCVLVIAAAGHPGVPTLPSMSWWGRTQTSHSSHPTPARTGRGAARAWFHVPGQHCQPLPPIVVPSWGCARSWSAVQPDGEDTAPSAPICNCQGQQEQCWAVGGPYGSCWSQGHLLSPGVSSWEMEGGSGRAAPFLLCRELLYKGSSGIIH